MKFQLKSLIVALAATFTMMSCSDNDDNPVDNITGSVQLN